MAQTLRKPMGRDADTSRLHLQHLLVCGQDLHSVARGISTCYLKRAFQVCFMVIYPFARAGVLPTPAAPLFWRERAGVCFGAHRPPARIVSEEALL